MVRTVFIVNGCATISYINEDLLEIKWFEAFLTRFKTLSFLLEIPFKIEVCSTFGIATEKADHDSTHKMKIEEPNQIIINHNNTDINMKTVWTNVYNYRLSKDYLSNEKKDSKFDEIYNEEEFRHKDKKSYVNDEIRQYKLKERYLGRLAKKRVKRDDDNKCETTNMKVEGKIAHPHPKGSKNYYSNRDCLYVIQAGDMQVIKLTFVDVFHIEDHAKCEYDYLEIRDGKEGYANLLGKFCGETFPSQIRSSGPYLWMKFHSDNTIEYEGFHIEVKFENTPESRKIPSSCYMNMTTPYGEINSKENISKDCIEGSSKNQGLDVIWFINVKENMKIYLNFTSYSLTKPNECEENLVQVYGSILEYDAKLAHYCGTVANSVTTKNGEGPNGVEKGNIMYIRMYKSKLASGSHFTAMYTSFRTIEPRNEEVCQEEEFDCEDNTCIPVVLKCDKTAHCRLKADEDQELCEVKTESVINKPHILVILVIFSLILSGMSFVFLFKCIRKLYQDHKIIKEHIQKSCEDRLDNLTDSRFTLDPKKLQRDSIPRASLERENHTNEMFKQQRNFPQRKPSSIDSDFIQETHIDEEEPWRREVDSIPIEAQDIKIERNGRTRRSDLSKKEESIRSKRESEERKERKEIRDVSVGVPDTKESGCQTRESLFQEAAPSSDGSGSNSRGFSTFGYSGATIARPSPAPATNTSHITIELLKQVPPHQESKPQKKISDRRPMSTETTRSAPDVIIVSKPIG